MRREVCSRLDAAVLAHVRPREDLVKPISDGAMQSLYGPGYHLMQSMGFKGSGNGLGRKEQGILSPVSDYANSRWPDEKHGLGGTRCYNRFGGSSLLDHVVDGREKGKAVRKRTSGKDKNFCSCPPPCGL